MLAQAHLAIAIVAGAGAIVVTMLVVAGRLSGRPFRFARDRAILVVLGLVTLGTVLGLGLLATGSRPGDPLHLVYASVALLVLPIARFWTQLSSRRGLAVGFGGLIVAALVVRLFQTG